MGTIFLVTIKGGLVMVKSLVVCVADREDFINTALILWENSIKQSI